MSTSVGGRISVETTRSGHENVLVDGVPYHSAYNPEREAAGYLSDYALEEADVVILLGWGLGYAGDVLASRLDSGARVIVLEPDPGVFERFERHSSTNRFLKDARFLFVVGSEVERFFESDRFDVSETSRYLWIEWPSTVRMHPDLAGRSREQFEIRLRDRAGNLLTHFQNGGLYFENAMRNLRYASDPSVGAMFGGFERVPLVLVSAGPSLDRNIRQLKGIPPGTFVLSVDTALRPLLAAGIVPHAVVIADPTALNAEHISGALPPETFLVAEQAVDPRAMSSAHRRFQFGVGVFPDRLYREFGIRRDRLEVWGSVATAALDLACRMGADPVIFVGQDFSFSWGRAYASGTIFDHRPLNTASWDSSETDLWGRPVPTTADLVAYRDWFRRRVAVERGIRFINATEGGILTGERIAIRSLGDAVTQFSRNQPDVRERLDACHRRGVGEVGRREEFPVDSMVAHLMEALGDGVDSPVPPGGSEPCTCRSDLLELIAKEGLVRRDDGMVLDALAGSRDFLRALERS